MRLSLRSSALAAASLTALLAATSGALAGGFAIREQSATAQGLSFAGSASGSGGLSSTFWNPATITMAPGWQSEWHISFIIPDVQITPLPPTPTLGFGRSGDIGEDAVVPASYSSYQINDRLWVGIANSAPFGLVTKPNYNWAGQVYSRTSEIFSLNVNPIVGYRVTDWLSIGGGPMIQYFDVTLRRATGVAPNAPTATLEGDDYGFGFTVGALITPFAGTSIGIGYRSSIHHELEGTLSPAIGVTLPIRANLNTPEQLTVGLSQVILPGLTAHLGFEWTNWSRLGTQAVLGPAGTPVTALPLEYEDGYFYSVGLEYWLNNQWAVRAGFAYEDSPITDEVRTTRLPDNDRYWFSAGATYRWSDRLQVDLAYTYITAKDTSIRIVPGHPDFAGLPFVGDADSSVNIISAAVKYRWDNPVQTVPVVAPAPVVRKY